MAITNLDYKLQGENLKKAVIDVSSRANNINGRYKKGVFGLDFYSNDYEIENYRWIVERANIADKKIEEYRLLGRDVDDIDVLKNIAKEVKRNIEDGKKKGSYINYIVYLLFPIIAVIIIILFFK